MYTLTTDTSGLKKQANLFIVNVEFLKGVDGDQNVSHIRVDEPLLIPFPQLGHQHSLIQYCYIACIAFTTYTCM